MSDYDVARTLVARMTGIDTHQWCGHRHVRMLIDMTERLLANTALIQLARTDLDAAISAVLHPPETTNTASRKDNGLVQRSRSGAHEERL